MDGTVHATQPRDGAQRFTRTTPDPDAKPHACERLAKTFTGEPATTAIIAPPTQKRMRNPRCLYAPADHLRARKVDIDADFSSDRDHLLTKSGRLRTTAAILRDGTLRQHKTDKSGHARMGLPSTLVPDYAADAFAVAVAGRVTGYPGELLWARWAGMDCRRLAAGFAWSRMIQRGDIDPDMPKARACRRAVMHGVVTALYGGRYVPSYANAARTAGIRCEWFTLLSKSARAEIRTALASLNHAFPIVRNGNDLPPELAPNI